MLEVQAVIEAGSNQENRGKQEAMHEARYARTGAKPFRDTSFFALLYRGVFYEF